MEIGYFGVVGALERALDPAAAMTASERLRALADVSAHPIEHFPTVADAPAPKGAEQTKLTQGLLDLADHVDHGNLLASSSTDALLLGDAQVGHELVDTAFRRAQSRAGGQAVRDVRSAWQRVAGWVEGMRTVVAEPQRDLFPPSTAVAIPEARHVPPVHVESTGVQLALHSDRAPELIAAIRASDEPFRARTYAEATRVSQSITQGHVVIDGDARTVGAKGENLRGELQVRTVDDAGELHDVVIKPAPDAHLERFAGSVARTLRMDRMMPAVGFDPATGAARIELRPGEPIDLSMCSSADLETHLARGYSAELFIDEEAARQLAHFDAQLLRCYDYILGNSDRHGLNIVKRDGGRIAAFDHGWIGNRSGASPNDIAPTAYRYSMVDGALEERIDDDVLAHIARFLDADALRAAADEHLAPTERRIVPGMIARLDELMHSKKVTWSPNSQDAGPARSDLTEH